MGDARRPDQSLRRTVAGMTAWRGAALGRAISQTARRLGTGNAAVAGFFPSITSRKNLSAIRRMDGLDAPSG
jgi:hypothetical protein